MKNLFALFVAFSAFFYSHLALAQTSGVGGWREGISSTGQSIWFGPNNATSGNRGMGQAIWNSVPDGVEVSPKVNLPTPTGPIDIVPKSKVSPAAASGAIGRAIPKLVKQVVGPLGVGMVLYDLAKELNYDLSKDSEGNLLVRKPDPAVCTASPCYEYQGVNDGVWYKSISAAGRASVGVKPAGCSGFSIYRYSYISDSPPNSFIHNWAYCNGSNNGFGSGTYALTVRTVAPSSVAYLPSSEQEFLDAVSAKSGWPSSSNLAKAVKDSLDIDPLNYVPMVPLLTTGPASVSSPIVKEITNDGTNTTEKTINKKTDLQYGTGPHPVTGLSVSTVTGTTNTTTNITITNNTTGAVTYSNSTVNNPAEKPADLGELTDTPFAAVPVLYTRKYPDGLTGVWNQKIVEIKAAPLFSLVGNLMPTNIGVSGSCPAFSLPVNFGQWGEYGTLDFSPPCFIWDFGKAIILISALLLSRRLIFGG